MSNEAKYAAFENNPDDNRDGENANAFGQGSRGEEESARKDLQNPAEALLDELVSGEHLTRKVAGNEREAHHHTSHQVAENQLQETEIGMVSDAGRADDGQNAGFGGDNGKGNCPPGQAAPAQKILAQGRLALAETRTEDGDGGEIGDHHQEVRPTDCHRSSPEEANRRQLSTFSRQPSGHLTYQ